MAKKKSSGREAENENVRARKTTKRKEEENNNNGRREGKRLRSQNVRETPPNHGHFGKWGRGGRREKEGWLTKLCYNPET